jgi:hypothetical protein
MNKTQLLALEKFSRQTPRELQAANPELFMEISTRAGQTASAAKLRELMDVPLKDNPIVMGELQQARMHRLGDLCELSQRKVKAVLARGLTIDTLDDQSLKSLVAEKRLKDSDAHQFGLAAGLFRLFDGDLDLTRAVMKKRLPDFGNHRAKQLRQLVTLDAAEWQRVLRKDKIAPPENTSLEEYAEIISRKVAALYPTDSYFVRLAPVHAEELSGHIRRVEPLFEQEAAVFHKPGFESLKSENIEQLDLEAFRKGYEQLAKSMDKIPGLTGLRLARGRAKSVSGNATPKITTSIPARSMFERFETGRFKPKTLVRMHDTYVELKRVANRYHGLGLAKLLDDPQLTPEQKAEQVATRVAWVEQVRAQNPDVELLKLDYTPGSADVASLKLDGLEEAEQSMVLRVLRTNQRVYALTRDVDHTRAILEAGYISGTGIFSAGYAAFVESTGLPPDAARRYYETARDMTVMVGAGLGAAMDTIWGGFRWLNVCNTREDQMENGPVKLDDYESLFGSQTYCNCKHCQSILSPAAYFVDLMRFLGSNIPASGMLQLNSRRPDLWTVELTCENTNTEIPTLDVVNEVLEKFLAQVQTGTPAQQEQALLILQMTGNFRRPFWPALEKLEGRLAHFDLTRAAIAREMETAPAVLAKALLGIVIPEEYILITQTFARSLRLPVQSMFYGIDFSLDASTNTITPLDVQEFLKPLGIGRAGLDELVKTHFVNGGIRIVPLKRSLESVQFDIEVVENLTLEVLDRTQRFTRLWHHLPEMNGGAERCWTILELDLVLRLLGSSQASAWSIDLENLAAVLALQERFGLSLMETCGLWCNDLQEVRFACQPTSTSLFERLFNPPALAQAGTPFPRLGESFVHPAFLKPGETTSEDALHRLHAGLKVNDEELYQLIVHLEQALGLDLAAGKYDFLLSAENLSLLYRCAQLSKLLGLGIPEFFQLTELDAPGVPFRGNLAALTTLLDFHDWWQASGYKLDEVGFITNGKVLSPNVYPDPLALAGQIQTKVQADKALEFAETLFAFLEGVTEAQSRQIITENPTILEAVNAEKTIFRLADEIDPATRLTIPDDVINAIMLAKGISNIEALTWLEEESWAGLLKYHSSRIIPASLATLMNVPVEKMDRLVTMTGMDLFNRNFSLILRDSSVPATFLEQLADEVLRLNALFGKQVFDAGALDFIFENQGIFSVTDLMEINQANIRKLAVYPSIAGAGAVKPSHVSSLLLDLGTWLANPSQANPDLLAQEISNVLQIEKGLAASLLNSLPLPQTAPEAVLKLARCANLIRRMGVGASVLPAIVSDDYNKLSTASDALLAAYKAKYQDEAEWQTQIMPLDDRLRSGKRDVLCHALSQIWWISKREVLTQKDLYDLLLIDVELEGCARTSKVVAAISSVQLYIQRILMNLEAVQPNGPEMAQEWEWRKNYRVWEANRKVFLYPENYIEPDLRDDKTPLFEELESKLLQQQITPQNVLDGYGAYLSGFEEVSRLKIAGSYHDKGSNADTLHLFGVTADNPPMYYYRAVRNVRLEGNGSTDWSHWRKVSVQIPVRKVSPIVYNGRLYVFWTEITTLSKNDLSNGASRFVGYKHTMSLKYTILRLDGTWTAPQGISLIDDGIFPLGKGIVDDPLLDSTEVAEWIRLNMSLQIAIAAASYASSPQITDNVINVQQALTTFQTTKMVTPQYDPDHKHSEPKDGYTLTGFLWDQVYPSVVDGDLLVTGRNYRMRSVIDFYRKAIAKPKSPVIPSGMTIPCLLPAKGNRTWVSMSDGNVLDWSPDDGTWRLWKCDLTHIGNIFPGYYYPGLLLNHGRWDDIRAGHLLQMQDGRVLDWVAADGTWRLWNYVPDSAIILQEVKISGQESQVSGTWGDIRSGHTLVRMPDGRVLDYWVVSKGVCAWRLWNYTLTISTDTTTIFSGQPYKSGVISDSDITAGDTLTLMADGRVLWLTANGSWRLWSYDPQSALIFSKSPSNSGRVEGIAAGDTLIPVGEDKILVFVQGDRTWRWLDYDHTATNNDILKPATKDGQEQALEQGEISQTGHSLLVNTYPSPPHDGYASCSILSRWENILLYNSFRDQNEQFSDSMRYGAIAEVKSAADITPLNGSLRDCILDAQGDVFLLQSSETDPPDHLLKRIGTGMSEGIVRKLFTDGVDEMLNIESQLLLHEGPSPFDNLQPGCGLDPVTQGNLQSPFDFKHGPYGVYYREIFFHTPFLIANHLNSQGRFADAQRWYHYIFNPTSGDVTNPPGDHNWRYLEFRNSIPSLRTILTDPETIEVYKRDPFNPHAIARLRPSAYQKSIVMKYIDNLLDWADSLFSQFTRESVNEATMLYVIAAEILGERPSELGECGEGGLKPKNLTTIASQSHLYTEAEFLLEYPAALETRVLQQSFPAVEKTIQDYEYLPGGAELMTAGRSALSDLDGSQGTESKNLFSAYDWRKISRTAENHLSGGKQSPLIHDPSLIADFTASLIQSVCLYSGDLSQLDPSHNGPAQFEIRPVFCVPANDELLGYWDRVEDRLYKIRHCLDINGVRRDLALFAPEIDPHLLVRMKAAGLTLEDVLGATSGNLPPYRFAYLIEKARQYAGTVQGFGSALLSALEKKDVEELNLLRAIHEQNILKLTRQTRQWEIDAEAETIRALQERREAIQYRKSYYVGLKDASLIGWEKIQEVSQNVVTETRMTEAIFGFIAGILHLIPDTGSPFAMKYGGLAMGDGIDSYGTALGATADIASAIAISAGMEATFQRREQEWKHQIELADRELKEIERQLAAAEIRQEIVNKSLEIHDKNIEQAREVYDFYGDKFSSFGLYTWLSTQLRTLYRDAYQSALAMARLAERAYRFERDDDTSVLLDANYWDASHAGLLAGEQLSIALQNMERKFIETNYRTFEIDQSIPLAQIAPLALVQLRETGTCEFGIPETIFDLYYPGQYRRVIKAVRLTVPCVAGPYTNVGATLRLTRGQVRVEPKTEPNVLKDVPLQRSVCIAASRAQNDAGVFELNFHDERYMPFEGAGAVSDWRLELPSSLRPFDYNTISDVILHISYTAKDGGGTFKQNVETDLVTRLKQGNLCRLFSLRHEFPTEWAKFKSQTPVSNERFELAVNLRTEHYPFWSQPSLLNKVVTVELLAQNASNVTATTIHVFGSQDKHVTTTIGTLTTTTDSVFGDLLHGSLTAGIPAKPDQELKLFFETNAMTDLWVAVTWK